jgi:hypothetical protein
MYSIDKVERFEVVVFNALPVNDDGVNAVTTSHTTNNNKKDITLLNDFIILLTRKRPFVWVWMKQ